MGMNRNSIRNIVGGITTPPVIAQPLPAEGSEEAAPEPEAKTTTASMPEVAGQGTAVAGRSDDNDSGDSRRFAKRGRPKGGKLPSQTGNARKVKVSLYINETIINDLYEWAHADRIHPGEMVEAALKPFHEREAKRRKAGKE